MIKWYNPTKLSLFRSSLITPRIAKPILNSQVRTITIPKTLIPRNKLTPFSYVLLIIPGATFCLGCWQVKRRSWKLEIIKNLQAKMSDPFIDLPTDPSLITKEIEYRRVQLKGTFDHNKEILLGPRSLMQDGKSKESGGSLLSSGGTGFLVVTPFTLESGEKILVNRGWVDKRFTDQNKRQTGQVEGQQEIIGVVRLKEQRNPFMPKTVSSQKSFLYRDLDSMSEIASSLPIYVDAVDSVPGGPIGGQTRVTIRNEHLSYVITWYSLTVITACMWYKRYINPRAFI